MLRAMMLPHPAAHCPRGRREASIWSATAKSPYAVVNDGKWPTPEACLSDLTPDQPVERPAPAAANEKVKHDQRPEQRILDAAAFPVVAVVPVIGRDRDDHEDDDRP